MVSRPTRHDVPHQDLFDRAAACWDMIENHIRKILGEIYRLEKKNTGTAPTVPKKPLDGVTPTTVHGSGLGGCVYLLPTDERICFKLTTDRSEAIVVNKLNRAPVGSAMQEVAFMAGIVHYFDIVKLPNAVGKRSVYLIIMERVSPGYVGASQEELSALLELRNAGEALISQMLQKRSPNKTKERWRAAIRGVQDLPRIADVGDFVNEFYKETGAIIADTHRNNIGKRKHDIGAIYGVDYLKPTGHWLLIDPGLPGRSGSHMEGEQPPVIKNPTIDFVEAEKEMGLYDDGEIPVMEIEYKQNPYKPSASQHQLDALFARARQGQLKAQDLLNHWDKIGPLLLMEDPDILAKNGKAVIDAVKKAGVKDTSLLLDIVRYGRDEYPDFLFPMIENPQISDVILQELQKSDFVSVSDAASARLYERQQTPQIKQNPYDPNTTAQQLDELFARAKKRGPEPEDLLRNWDKMSILVLEDPTIVNRNVGTFVIAILQADASNVDFLEDMFRDCSNNMSIMAAIGSNPNTPLPILNQLQTLQDPYVLRALARNPSTPIATIKKWLKKYNKISLTQDDTEMLNALASNPSIPVAVLNKLSEHPSDYVRMGVASNKKITKEAAENLKNDSAAVTNLLAYNKHLPKGCAKSVLRSVASSAIDALITGFRGNWDTVVSNVGENPLFDGDDLAWLNQEIEAIPSEEKRIYIQHSMAQNPNLPQSVFDTFHHRVKQLKAIQKNPSSRKAHKKNPENNEVELIAARYKDNLELPDAFLSDVAILERIASHSRNPEELRKVADLLRNMMKDCEKALEYDDPQAALYRPHPGFGRAYQQSMRRLDLDSPKGRVILSYKKAITQVVCVLAHNTEIDAYIFDVALPDLSAHITVDNQATSVRATIHAIITKQILAFADEHGITHYGSVENVIYYPDLPEDEQTLSYFRKIWNAVHYQSAGHFTVAKWLRENSAYSLWLLEQWFLLRAQAGRSLESLLVLLDSNGWWSLFDQHVHTNPSKTHKKNPSDVMKELENIERKTYHNKADFLRDVDTVKDIAKSEKDQNVLEKVAEMAWLHFGSTEHLYKMSGYTPAGGWSSTFNAAALEQQRAELKKAQLGIAVALASNPDIGEIVFDGLNTIVEKLQGASDPDGLAPRVVNALMQERDAFYVQHNLPRDGSLYSSGKLTDHQRLYLQELQRTIITIEKLSEKKIEVIRALLQNPALPLWVMESWFIRNAKSIRHLEFVIYLLESRGWQHLL